MAVADRREREREARCQSILDAAERIMCQCGFASTTMDVVAAEAELSKGALYLYFDNKDALCAAIAERALDEVYPRLKEAMEGEPTGLGRMRRALELHAQFFQEHPHLYRMMVSWMLVGLQSGEETEAFASYRQAIGRSMSLAIESIELGKSDGTIRADVDPLHLALQMWAGFIGVTLFQLSREDFSRRVPYPVDVDRLTPTYIDNMLRAVRGPNAQEDR
ncbi:MAG: TetR/AcrR family transcriptional regulator [Polyangiales bacterium]